MASPNESAKDRRPSGEISLNQQSTHIPRIGLPLAFALVGMFIVFLGGISSQVSESPTTQELGLLQLLSPIYWVGLSLMGLAVGLAFRTRSSGLVVLTGVLFFAIYAGTPVLFEPNPPFWDAYVHLSEAQSIEQSGHLATAQEFYSANWPGAFLVFAFTLAISALAPLGVLGTLPFITGGLTFLALFIFLRSLLPDRWAAVGAIMGSLLNVWAKFHVSPQSLGLLLALLVLGTVWRKEVGLRVANALLFVGLVIIHPISALLVLTVLVAHTVMVRIGYLRKSNRGVPSGEDNRFAHNPSLPYATVWVGWLFFQAVGTTRVGEEAILARMGSILLIPEETVIFATGRTVENLFFWAPQIRLASVLVFGAVGILALVLIARRGKSRRASQFLWAGFVGVATFAVLEMFVFGGVFFDRALMLFAVFAPAVALSMFGASKGRKTVRVGILTALLVASAAAASTSYYLEAFYFVPDRAVAVSTYLERAAPDSLVLDGLFPVPVWIDPDSRTPRTHLAFWRVYPRDFVESSGESTVYAVFDPTAELWYRQWRGIEIYRFYEASRSIHSLIFANGHATIFLLNPSSAAG